MDRPATTNPATARDIILEIVRNMRGGLEPLHYSTLPPAVYHVYLHPDDMERLRGIAAAHRRGGAARARCRAGDRSIAASLAERLKLARRGEPKVAAPEGGWQIRILENTDDDVEPGDIVIYSELALPAKPEFGAGAHDQAHRHAAHGRSGDGAPNAYQPAPARRRAGAGAARPSPSSNTRTTAAARRIA